MADTKGLGEELDVTDLKSSDSDSGDGHSGGEEAPLPSDQSLFSNTSDHSETTDSEASDTRSPIIEHTIIFKYIGTTKCGEYQNFLSIAKKELSLSLPVPVRLMLEPNNPMDNKAIAFECSMQGK